MTLADKVAEIENDAKTYQAALMAIFSADTETRLRAIDYRQHPDFERLREAIQDARRAMMKQALGWTDEDLAAMQSAD